MILGVFGPAQVFAMLFAIALIVAVPVGLIVLFGRRAKYKAEVEMLKNKLAEKRNENKEPRKPLIPENEITKPEIKKEIKPKMTSDEALAELKRAKDKLDVGLITQEEFIALRAKLGPLVD